MANWLKIHYRLSLLTVCVICVLTVIGWATHDSNILPIQGVVVRGDFESSKQPILQRLITPLVQTGFFTVRLDDLQSQIQGLPWVANVMVKRVWPNRVVIDVFGRQAVARWNDADLLNPYGEIFNVLATQVDHQQLPKFYGQPDDTVTILSAYQTMNAILAPLNLSIASIRLDELRQWHLTFNDGINLQLGSEDVLTKLHRFVKVYPQLAASHKTQAKSVDLRYASGMAVVW